MLYEAFVLIRGNRVVVLFIPFLKKRESVEKFGKTNNGLVFTFLFLRASTAGKPQPVSPITTKASENMFSADTRLSGTLLGPG